MRIYSLALWVLPASVFTMVTAQDTAQDASFTFDGRTFNGEIFNTQSSVFQYRNIKDGHMFNWTQEGVAVDVVRVDIMNENNQSIVSWCSDGSCPSEGFNVINLQEPVPEIKLGPEVMTVLHDSLGTVLYFRLDWQHRGGKRDGQRYSTYSQNWAIVDDAVGEEAASSVYSASSIQMTAGAQPTRAPGLAPTSITSVSVSGTATSTTSTSSTPTATATAAGATGRKSSGLTTGAIVGIVVGCVGGLILVSVVAGCFCFRRRRNIDPDGGGSRGVQDIIAEKEAHASILDRDQPDTPYSEQNSQNPLNRGVGMPGRNESGIDLSIGQAISGEGCGSIRSESVYTGNGGHDRNSAVYSSLGGAANSVHGTPVIGSAALASGNSSSPTQNLPSSVSIHDRSSAMGSPVPRSSLQQDRSFSPYTDRAAQHDYSQHHHVVDGADLVQQEHSNDSTARSPSSLYSNPLEELQPISPESAREHDGAATAAAAAAAAGASQPRGHARSTTPSGISGQYAHLVEEGMTDDEIRRLEEEERVLDEAIEQAGTGGRKR